MTTLEVRYIGRIVSVPENVRIGKFGFIGSDSVTKEDGTPHCLETHTDIFVHQDDCSVDLGVGIVVLFTVVPDRNRGAGNFRAMGAVGHVEVELIPAGVEALPGFGRGFNQLAPFGATDKTSLEAKSTPAQVKMKRVSPELVQTALANRPAPEIPRDSSVPQNVEGLMQLFLRHLFPTMAQFSSTFSLSGDEEELRRQVSLAKTDLLSLGMKDQIVVMEEEVARFDSFRAALCFMVQENLVRRDTIIPHTYLPDLFMAVPVWYFWADASGVDASEQAAKSEDPHVHASTTYFCNLFPNQNWADMYQMFNRRFRTLQQYKGDIIPPHITRRIRKAVNVFDYVVIMTPYLDVAGEDWQDPAWVRSIDPYVVGFKKGIPYAFILARFSDSGTFPLFTELVGDTMAFLKTNGNKLAGFNKAINPFWYMVEVANRNLPNCYSGSKLGDHLLGVSRKAIAAFEAHRLFDWLRGEAVLTKRT